jgi:hypothetical protein
MLKSMFQTSQKLKKLRKLRKKRLTHKFEIKRDVRRL